MIIYGCMCKWSNIIKIVIRVFGVMFVFSGGRNMSYDLCDIYVILNNVIR